MLENESFENGWVDIYAGNGLTNQIPNSWHMRWLNIGEQLFGTDEAHGVPEMVHKLSDQLPPNERPGGSDPLILDGEVTYKIFHNGASFGAELWQVVTGLTPGSTVELVAPMRIHDHAKSGDFYAAETGAWLLSEWAENGNECEAINGAGYWQGITDERKWNAAGGWSWYYHTVSLEVPDSGSVCVLLRVKSKWDQPVDFFIDDIQFTSDDDGGIIPPPSDDLTERVEQLEAAVISLSGRVAQLEAVSHTHDDDNDIPTISERALFVDVSAHQGVFDWQTAKEHGIEYAIIRSSNGLGSSSTDENGRDLQLYRNASECTRLGIPFSIYHYFQPNQDLAAQINLVNSILVDLSVRDSYPSRIELDNGNTMPLVWCDVEEGDINHLSVKNFCVSHGAGIYTSKSIWEYITRDATVEWWSAFCLWVAQWGTNDGQIPAVDKTPWIPDGFLEVDLWQFTSQGGALVGWYSDSLDVNIAGPFEPPPTGELVDLSPYFESPADVGYWLVMRKIHGGEDVGTIDHQNQMANGITYRLKGSPYAAEYEEIRVNDGYVWRRYDTSPGDGRYYKLNDAGYEWSKWCPSSWRVGQTYERNPLVSWFNKSDCKLRSAQQEKTYLTFAALHDTWQGAADGLTFNDVIELHWKFTPDGEPAERYFLAPRYSYVGWQNAERFHYCVSIESGREPMTKEVVGCLN